MTSRERAEMEADAQLKEWPADAPWGILRTAIRNDLMVPAIDRAIDAAVAEACEDCAEIAEGQSHEGIAMRARARGTK